MVDAIPRQYPNPPELLLWVVPLTDRVQDL
jgi:hypothetical protein